jgi:trimethylamine--corrinoid protein Co-methyltransferase
MLMHAAILSGANYIWHVAGWLEAGLCASYAKFVLDCEQLGGWYKYAQGVDVEDLKAAMEAVREVGPAGHFLGTAHTLKHFESAFFMPTVMDFNSYEQWAAEGALDAAQRALNKARTLLDSYQEPRLDESKIEALEEFIARREREIPPTLK